MLCKLSPLVTWWQEMSTADSHCQEAEQIIQTRNCAFLQAEDKKGRLGSCVFGEMWKNEIAEARSCVSNEVNSFNLKCSVFSVSVSAVTYDYTQWRCLVALSAPLSVSAPLQPQTISRDKRRGFSPGWGAFHPWSHQGCWAEPVFHWAVTSITWVLSVTDMSQGWDLGISINTT